MGKDCTEAHTGRMRTAQLVRKVCKHCGVYSTNQIDELKDSTCSDWTAIWWSLTPCHIQERPKDSLLDLGKT
jgi:hypothetical protein